MKTLERQHKITLRRVDRIQRQLDALPQGTVVPEPSLVEWFLGHIIGLTKGRRNGTGG